MFLVLGWPAHEALGSAQAIQMARTAGASLHNVAPPHPAAAAAAPCLACLGAAHQHLSRQGCLLQLPLVLLFVSLLVLVFLLLFLLFAGLVLVLVLLLLCRSR